MSIWLNKLQIEIAVLGLIKAAEELKEYDAPWLKESKKVTRDGTGRFASKVREVKDEVEDGIKEAQEIVEKLIETGKTTTDAIKQLIKNPEYRERSILSSELLIGKTIQNLEQITNNPAFKKQINKLDEQVEKISQELIEEYGDDQNPLHQAVRKAEKINPPEDSSLSEKVEFAATKFSLFHEALLKPEDYSRYDERRDELKAGLVSAAGPILLGVVISVVPDLVIPLMIGHAIEFQGLLLTLVTGEITDHITKDILEELEVENPVLKIAIRLAASVATTLGTYKVTDLVKQHKKIESGLKQQIQSHA